MKMFTLDLRAKYLLTAVLITLAVVAVLSPMLHSPLDGDDVVNSARFARTDLSVQGATLGAVLAEDQHEWAPLGLFRPLMGYQGVLFYLLDGNVVALRLIVLGVILTDLALLAWFVWRVSQSPGMAMAAPLFSAIAIQFRVGADPVLVFAGIEPLMAGLLLGSLVAYLGFLETGSRRSLGMSLVLYGLSIFTIEITIPLVAVFVLAAWLYPARTHSLRRLAIRVWPHVTLAATSVAAGLVVRVLYHAGLVLSQDQYLQAAASGQQALGGAAYNMHVALVPITLTIAKQVFGAFPLASLAATLPPGVSVGHPGLLEIGAVAVLFLAGSFAVVKQLAGEQVSVARSRWQLVAGVSLALIILSNLLIALSPRYQAEVTWGGAYIPVYFSCLGVAVLLGMSLRFAVVNRPHSRAVSLCLVLVMGIAVAATAVVTYERNDAVVQVGWQSLGNSRELLTSALDRGLLREMPADSVVVDASRAYWAETKEYIAGESGSRVESITPSFQLLALSFPSRLEPDPSSADMLRAKQGSTFEYLSYASAWRGDGAAIAGRIRSFSKPNGGGGRAVLQPAYVYLSTSPKPFAGFEQPLPAPEITGDSVAQLGLDPSKFQLVANGEDWALYRGDELVVQ